MIILYKPLGLTPYQAILSLKEKRPDLQEKKLSYAGRLDPMAEGLLMILEDEENKKRRIFEKSDKTYEFEVILGFNSDSYDLLGIADFLGCGEGVKKEKIDDFISKNKGKILQQYPPYSSIKVEGKPLYWWTRRKKDVERPKKEVDIKKFEFTGEYYIDSPSLKKEIDSRIPLVSGDFRQEEILGNWKEIFDKKDIKSNYRVLKFRVECSAGAYVRSIANSMGEFFECGAVTFSIKRTKIGKHKLKDAYYL